jgi:histidinol-phosphate aminotransferase
VLKYSDGEHDAASKRRIETLLAERARMTERLAPLPLIRRIWPSDANFVLVECVDADRVLRAAFGSGLIIRDQRAQPALPNCLRISVGTPEQNERLIRGIAQAAGVAA